MSNIIPVQEEIPETIFGEVSTAEITPLLQISAQYGQEDDLNILMSNGGSYLIEDSLYKVTSGTNPLGLSSLNSKKQARYKPGQGMIARLTGIFDAPQSNSLQACGFITSEDSLAFGYYEFNGDGSAAEFGVIRATGGVVEAQELTITTPAGGAENATININGTPYTVPLTSGTVQHNAWEIANSLQSQVDNYLFSSNDDQVYCMAQIPGVAGSFSFSSATAVGSFVQQAAGQELNISFTPQSQWTEVLKGLDLSWFNPNVGNIYEVKFAYLGFSAIEFYIKNSQTNEKLLVHTLDYSGQTTPIVRNPSFRIGWVARNLGNTTSITVQGASAMGAIEGKEVPDGTPRGIESTQLSVGATRTNVITIRNRFHFGDIINRASVQALLLSFATDSTRGAFFEIVSGATFGGDLDFEYIDRQNSVLEIATDSVTVSGGRFIASFIVKSNGLVLSSSDFLTRIEPDQVFTISAQVIAGSASDMDFSASVLEDL